MPNWNGTVLTAKGRNLQAKVEAGASMTITKLKIGDGTLGSGQSIDNLTDLVAPKKNISISNLTPLENGQCKISAVVTNSGLGTGFYVRELGIFAQDPDLGEILYAYTADGSPDYLPPEGGPVAVSEELAVTLVFSNAANISAVISLDGLVTTAMLNTHKTKTPLDHPDGSVTTAKIADSSVTDIKIGNRTITDTTALAGTAAELTVLLSRIGNMIKQITGKSNWYTAPAATIEALNSGKQPLDATLTALAALTTAADKMIYSTGSDAFAVTALTAFARTILDDADASTARTTLGAAPIVSPGFTGTPTAPTATAGTNTTQLATTAFVLTAIANLVDSSPAALDTLNELAAALGDDPNFATTMATALGNKQPLDATLTAIAALTTAANQMIYSTGADTFALATLSAFARTLLDDADAATARTTLGAAPSASPTFTGIPAAPTPAAGTNTTQLATTAFVQAAVGAAKQQIVIVNETQPSGTNGGTFTSGAWRTRVLNTIAANDDNIASLASNQITLPAGTYLVDASAPIMGVDLNQLRLQNITDGTTLVTGTSENTFASLDGNSVQIRANLSGCFTLNAAKVLELQHKCTITCSNYGFGYPASQGLEIYSILKLIKVE